MGRTMMRRIADAVSIYRYDADTAKNIGWAAFPHLSATEHRRDRLDAATDYATRDIRTDSACAQRTFAEMRWVLAPCPSMDQSSDEFREHVYKAAYSVVLGAVTYATMEWYTAERLRRNAVPQHADEIETREAVPA